MNQLKNHYNRWLLSLLLTMFFCSYAKAQVAPAVTGIVKDSVEVLVGATVTAENVVTKKKSVTGTNGNGIFTFMTLPEGDYAFTVSYIGYASQTILGKVKKEGTFSFSVYLKKNVTNLDKEVVITGMTTRKKASFTGATAVFSGDDLKQHSNQNIIQSLKILDPSLIQIDNNVSGSNPNVLPTIELRGQTSISTANLRDQFSSDPNQPLFILDGFETSLRTIIDLDMNTVESVTILKDAASTAIYGSRASNGVIVVETKKPVPGKVRLSYTSDLQIELPDLSSYNMMNAAEKLEFEKLAGKYSSTNPTTQLLLDTLYNSRLREVQRGVNTYWLSQPIQTGFSQRHSISAAGGDAVLRYDAGVNIKHNDATMIGSKRNDWGANLNLNYRTGIINISNRVYVSGSKSSESPYGSFSDWVRTNPYYRLSGSGNPYLSRVIVDPIGATSTESTPNPLYNALLNSFNRNSNFNILNNFQLYADLAQGLRIQLNGQVQKGISERTNFISPLNTRYLNLTDQTLKGSYTLGKINTVGYTANLNVSYAKIYAQKHSLTAMGRVEFSQSKNESNGYTALGFPNASNGNPTFAYGFPQGSTPNAASLITRRNSFVGSLNYSYDQRYNLDANLNIDGATAFGSQHRYSPPYFSVGLSWNVDREKFMEHVKWISSLRLRGNYGKTGNQNFGNVTNSVYSYYSTINGTGQGIYLYALGAAGLKWQKTSQYSLGVDAKLFKNLVDLQLNAYQKYTNPLVVAVSLPSSTGLNNYPFNAGASTVRGLETMLKITPIFNPGQFVWSVSATAASITQKYSHFNNLLSSLNKELLSSNSLVRYQDGYSVYDIWAVPSLGIDPASGKEVFMRKDGQHTFTYDPKDIQVVGSSKPRFEGVLSTNINYKGFLASVAVRYVVDRDLFNDALFQKVENISSTSLIYNQDRRALYNRWHNPGDISPFKNISLTDATPMSSRFVQKENLFSGESLSIGYEFRKNAWLNKLALSTLSINAYSNDFFYASTVQRERGIDYPFAKSISMSIRATFK